MNTVEASDRTIYETEPSPSWWWYGDIKDSKSFYRAFNILRDNKPIGLYFAEPWGFAVIQSRDGDLVDAAVVHQQIGDIKVGRQMWLSPEQVEVGKIAKPAVTIAPLDKILDIVDLPAMLAVRKSWGSQISETRLKNILYGLLSTGVYTELLLKPEYSQHIANWLPKEVTIDGQRQTVASMLVTCPDKVYPRLWVLADMIWNEGNVLLASSANISGHPTLVGEPEPVWDLLSQNHPDSMVLDNELLRKTRDIQYPNWQPNSGTVINASTHPLLTHEDREGFMVVVERAGNLGLMAVENDMLPIFSSENAPFFLQYASDIRLKQRGKVLILPEQQFYENDLNRELVQEMNWALGFYNKTEAAQIITATRGQLATMVNTALNRTSEKGIRLISEWYKAQGENINRYGAIYVLPSSIPGFRHLMS